MNNLFAIGIPTINRADLLNPTLERYVEDFPRTRIFIVDNGEQEIMKHPNIVMMTPAENMGVAASWNVLCDAIYGDGEFFTHEPSPKLVTHTGCRFAWIMNDDIYSGRQEHEIREFLEQDQEADFDFITPLGNWSNFIMSLDCYHVTGPFDAGFYPAYFEDNDYRYRMKLLRARYTVATILNPETLGVSSSIQRDPSLNSRFQANLDRYKRKWGGVPEEETFRKPFDGKNG